MRLGRIILGVTVAALGSVSPLAVYGYPYNDVQDPSGPAVTGIFAMSRNAELASSQNPGNSFKSSSFLEGAVAPGGRPFNPDIWLPCNGTECTPTGPDAPPRPEPGFRESTVNAMPPMSGFQSVINSMAYSNQAANALVAPMTLMNVAMQLTEPGISAGLSMALNNVNQALQNRYLANQAFIANASVSPEGKLALKAYQACMQKKMSVNRLSWPQADAECQGGEIIANDSSITAFNTVSREGFTFRDDYAHATNADGQAPNRPDGEMTLTDYIFNPELAGAGNIETMNEMRQSFIETIGDIKFSFSTGAELGARRLLHRREPPQVLPEELYRRHTLVAYNVVHELLFGMCQRFAAGGGQVPQGTYFANQSVQGLMARLAVPSYQPNMSLLQAFFREYKESLGRVSECNVLRSWEGGRTSFAGISQGNNWATFTTRMSRVIFSFAELIGRLKTLNTYLSAEQVVRSLSAGSFDSTIRELALDAIYDVAGTRDIQREYDKTAARLQDFARLVVAENVDAARAR